MEYQYKTFIGEKYRELREEEQLFFQAAPSMRVAKKLIQVAALPPAAAVAATHAPIVGPVVAGAVGQATHLMQSGMHGIAADRIANHFSELASQVPQGWGRQAAFDAWAKVRTADMLAKTDAWTRPLSGFAAPTMIGKGMIDTGKLAISYAKQGIPTVVARPVVHMWKMTNHFINRAQAWFDATLSKLPEQVQQNVRSAIDNIQRSTTAMAESLNLNPSQGDLDRRSDYMRMLSEQRDEPELTFESLQTDITDQPSLGTDYDKQVVYQALKEGKTLDEATAIISQGPNVTQMSQANLQDVSVYLSETTNSVWKQYNIENPSPEVTHPDAQTLAESNGIVAEPLDPKLKEQYIQLLSESLEEPDLTWDEVQERINQDPDLAWEYDERVAVRAQENGIDDPKKLSELIAQAPEWDGVERPKPADIAQEDPGLQEDSLEARRMINEDILEKMGRFVDLQNLSIRLNGRQVVGLGRDGAYLEDKTSITTEQAQIIRDVLDNPKAHPGTEITIKVGTRVAFRLKDGIVQPDKFGIAQKSQELEAKTPQATKEQIENLTPEQKKLVADMKKMGLDTTNTINKMVHRTQTNRPTIPKSEDREVTMSR
ncbi:hypothetical protein ON05_036370 (plasmid) [Acaryochloris sp. CCMEE 5410]|nr:hypothetical protein ON05_036370 [Acaryochloris sp. CCMEE 5410]